MSEHSKARQRLEMSDLGAFKNLSDEEILSELNRRGISTDGPTPSIDRIGMSSDYCERCGSEKRGAIEYTGRNYCNCETKIRAARAAIRETDLAGDMAFDSIAADSDLSVAKAADELRKVAAGAREKGLFLFGLPGRGKTHLQIACARECLENDRLVGVYSLANLVSRIQETYGYSDAESKLTKTKIIEEVASHQVVILDDIGKEHRSADTESIVYQLVDLLYRKRRTLVASSNLPGKDFVGRYDGAVLSRLGGMCEKVVIRGEDRREAAWSW